LEVRVLVWSNRNRFVVWGVFTLLFGVVYGLPMAMIALASFSGQWNGVLPSHLTFGNYAAVLQGDSAAELRVSLITGAVASVIALLLGSWAAIALRAIAPASRQVLGMLFFVPSAVPSVSVGLGLLVAFSRPPVLLNGTTAIVIVAHLVLVSAFAYGNLSAGLARLPPDYEQVAASLGARGFYRLRRVTFPLLLPYMIAAFSLSFAVSMGELGATVMVYPPGWVTMPVGIFALTDRGDVFQGAALTMVLALSTLVVLIGVAQVPTRAAAR
jgi:2-aminoethylphosphonate transport system permease protein